MMLTSMGFPDKAATRALRKCDGNLERAADFAMNHIDEADSADEAPMQVDESAAEDSQSNNDPFKETDEAVKGISVFKLQSFITHLGASIHAVVTCVNAGT